MALFAAYMLVLQSLAAVFSLTANAAGNPADSFAAVICSSVGGHSAPDREHGSSHDPMPDCCMPGCRMLAPVALVPPAGGAFSSPAPEHAHRLEPAGERSIRLSRERTPANPRAPPVVA